MNISELAAVFYIIGFFVLICTAISIIEGLDKRLDFIPEAGRGSKNLIGKHETVYGQNGNTLKKWREFSTTGIRNQKLYENMKAS